VLKKILGAWLLIVMPLSSAAADKKKTVYELIYEDIQVLKQQLQQIDARVQKNAESITAVRENVKELADLFRRAQTDQAGSREDLKSIPSQYLVLLQKIEELSLGLQRISEELAAMKAPLSPPEPPEETPSVTGKKTPVPEKKAEEKPSVPVKPMINPEEAYKTAYADYLKGNFDLAIEGFRLFQKQFPTSLLADNALYWIGECYFSQRRFDEAIAEFNNLILTFPQGDKVAAAHLKKGISFSEMGKKEEAIAAYKLLISKYPQEEEAKIAQQKINDLAGK
jgi:tol-pal system protein YbgF